VITCNMCEETCPIGGLCYEREKARPRKLMSAYLTNGKSRIKARRRTDQVGVRALRRWKPSRVIDGLGGSMWNSAPFPHMCRKPCSVHFLLPPRGDLLGKLSTGPVYSPNISPFCTQLPVRFPSPRVPLFQRHIQSVHSLAQSKQQLFTL
jgi:hypothetical protein